VLRMYIAVKAGDRLRWTLAERAEDGLHSLRESMNHDKSSDAASEQKRGCHKRRAQAAPGIEPAVAAKRDCDIPLKLSLLPTSQAAPDRQYHRHLKQAAGPRGGEASRGENLREQKYRHS
jgi:hypothetical protein